MAMTLVSVLREFELVPNSTAEQENIVFESHFQGDDGEAIKFTRFIQNSEEPWTDTVIRMNDTEVLGPGEDPRCFFWRGSPCISTCLFAPDSGGFFHKIYICNERRWLVAVLPKHVETGKNWAPFVRDGALYFIHEMAPFRVIKAREPMDRDCLLFFDLVVEYDIKAAKSLDRYANLRGGSNAVVIGDKVIGFGHTNHSPDKKPESLMHRPFLYIYEPEVGVSFYEVNYSFEDRFRIIDPTSLYLKDGRLYLVTSETERVWHITPQRGRACLYAIDLTGEDHEDSLGIGGRRLHRWTHGQAPAGRGLLGAWRRRQNA